MTKRAELVRKVAGYFALTSLALLGCGGGDGGPVVSGAGGGFATNGGNASAGGSVASNGGSTAPPNGGQGNAQGGSIGSGGLVGQGGAVTSGGGQSVGGAVTNGGGNSTNGGTTNGGAATGGSKATGGTKAAGGAGAGASAGGAASGGKSSAGGASGGKASGGNSAGGAASGGTGTGGTSSGGNASGGAAVGGNNGGGTTPIKVWIAGDSTVQNCSSACPCGWGSQFDALFNTNVTVVNSAVGGRSIQTWLYEGNVSSTMGTNGECTLTSTTYNARWTAMTNTSTGMKAGDYLFIQFGINDGDSTCPRHVGQALYKTYLATMAQAAKAVGAQPVFLTPVSAISCSGSTAVATRGFLTETKEAGTANNVPVIDLHQLSINLYNKLALCPNSADYTSTTSAVGLFFCADHTHFEAAGAKQIAQVVAQALKDQKLGLAAYLL